MTLYLGDCLDILRQMPDNSIDALVTDPPAGIGFMGKEWDNFGSRRNGDAQAQRDKYRAIDSNRPGYAFMGGSNVNKKTRDAFVAFMVEVMSECLRVLKPGAHALVWALPRTSHWTGWALEEAGFEVRDRIAHLFGSGFPKSLSVDKAIDKMAGAEREVVGPSVHHAPGRSSDGTRNSLRQLYRGDDDGKYITLPATPAAAQWEGWGTALKPACEDWWLCRKPLGSSELDIRQAVEYNMRENGLEGEIRWTQRPAKPAEKQNQSQSSTLTKRRPSAVGISAEYANENAMQPIGTETANCCGNVVGNGDMTIMSESLTQAENPTELTRIESGHTGANLPQRCETQLSKPMAGNAPVAENPDRSSLHSTIQTEAAGGTEQSPTGKSTETYRSADSLKRDTACSAGIVTAPLVDTDIARTIKITFEGTDYDIPQLINGLFVWPDALPVYRPAEHLSIAANVLEWGTGAINVDGCRIEGVAGDGWWGNHHRLNSKSTFGASTPDESWQRNPQGRFPANVTHDGSEEVLAGFPSSAGAAAPVHRRNGDKFRNTFGSFAGDIDEAGSTFRNDSGSAARFFYCSKASRQDREEGCEGLDIRQTIGGGGTNDPNGDDVCGKYGSVKAPSRNHHPTVKPTPLMRWLCRLITPPGGTVLDPFMGSGSTGKAAALEGFGFIGIELDPEYFEIAKRRIEAVQHQPQMVMEL